MTSSRSDFSQGRVSGHIIRQAVPLALAQLIHLLYNVVDRIYLGHLPGQDSTALTGVGITFPIITMIAAFTNLYSTGGTPLFSIARGAKNDERASGIMGTVFWLLGVTSLALMAFIAAFRRPLLYAFGASDTSFVYASTYLMIYLLGTPFSMFATGMNGFINAQGFPNMGMLTTVIGAVINLLLDPLFIFVFKMGVAGAALATVLCQLISCLWVLRFLTGKQILMPLRRETIRFDPALVKEIIPLGLSGFVMQATNGIVQAVCNSTLFMYGGDLFVGIMTVLNSVREIGTLPVMGISDGAQPVLGYNYGAGEFKRVRSGILFMTLLGVSYTCFAWALALLIPKLFISIFTNDPAMLQSGPHALRLYFFGFCFMSFQFCGQSAFKALGFAKQAVFFSIFRKVIIVVPLTLLLPRLGFGVDGIFLAEPISNLIGGLACYITMLYSVYRKLGTQKN